MLGWRRSEPLSESLPGKRGSEEQCFEGTQGRLGSVHQRAINPYEYKIMRELVLAGCLGGTLFLLIYSATYNLIQSKQIDQLKADAIKQSFEYDVCIERVQQLTARERPPK